MTAVPPSGVVTFLFTDVEGSTRRWEADADGMRLALAAHDRVLRAAIEAHGGGCSSTPAMMRVDLPDVGGGRCGGCTVGTGICRSGWEL